MTRQQLADDLRQMVEDDPVPFTFSGSIYMGCWGGVMNRKQLEIGGYELEMDATIVIPLMDRYGNATFQERPQLKSRIEIRGKTYSVERIEIDPQEACIQLDLSITDA